MTSTSEIDRSVKMSGTCRSALLSLYKMALKITFHILLLVNLKYENIIETLKTGLSETLYNVCEKISHPNEMHTLPSFHQLLRSKAWA